LLSAGEFEVKDRVAVVTGASSGIGAATAELLAREGAVVAAVARRADRLADLVKAIEAAGGRAAAFPADIAREPEARKVLVDILARYGRIDILVNGAGIVRPGSVETADPAAWREQIDINLLAAMYLSQGVLPGMRARRDGHIVTVSSTAGRYVGTRHSGYTASKHAVNAFTETLRQEVAELGIRVTIVEPGATTTEVFESIPDASDRAAMTQHITKQGNMRAEDVANAILFALRQPANVNVREIWLAPTAAVR
jgi:NADP-dependent 3-hydroxy acid dehydrogenase YdfG